jgi:hypothetical protein
MLGKHLRHCEDSLTGAILGHLLYLPIEIAWQLLRNACHATDLPEVTGEPEIIEFWPNWNPSNTANTRYVEPDVFLRFRDFDLIIEAKRRDYNQQYRGQWQQQLTAYANEYGKDKRPVRFMALGGIWDTKDAEISHPSKSHEERGCPDDVVGDKIVCPVHMCRWRGLLHECRKLLAELERLSFPSSQTHANRRILGQMVELFGWHGYSTGVWFGEIGLSRLRLGPGIEGHIKDFTQCHLKPHTS